MAASTNGNGAAQAAPAPTGHSRFGASASERWLECPGSIGMSEGMPNEQSGYAREGTALHALTAHCLTADQDAVEWIDRPFKYDDHGEPCTIEVDEEQAEAVQLVLDTVRDDKASRGGKLLIETRFHLDHLHEECFGTADVCRIGEDNILCVYDAKFGKGVAVEVTREGGKPNSQFGYYAIGAEKALHRLIEKFNVKEIELVVVQPRRAHRDGPVRRVTVTHADLLELAGEITEAIANALSDAPRFKVGDHCKWCRGASKCNVLRSFAFDTANLDFDDETGAPVAARNLAATMSNMDLGKTLDAADILDAWIAAVRANAHHRADSGEDVPGWKLVDKRATRKWKDEEKAASELQFVFGLDAISIFRSKLLSPAQAEKLLKKEERNALAELYDKSSSGTKLARSTDVREARPATAQTDFDDGHSASEW